MRRSSHRGRSLRVALLVALIVAAIAGTTSLGFWQLRRAAGKEVLLAQSERLATAVPVAPDAAAWRAPEALVGQRVRLTGRWLADRVVFLDNRPDQGRSGFYVLMTLRTDTGADVVVNRGWTPRDGQDRARAVSFRTDPGTVSLTGVVAKDEPRWLELGPEPDRRIGAVWQNFDFDAFARASGLAPVRVVVRADPLSAGGPEPDGLERHWPERSGSLEGQIDRHRGYAVQWFALAVTLAVLAAIQAWRAARPRPVPR